MGAISAYPILTEAKRALDEGRQEQAAGLVMQHMRAHPGEPRGTALLGAVAMKAGALLQAENFLRQAIARGADTEDVRRDLAACVNLQERPDEALQLLLELTSSKRSNPELLATIASIRDKLGQGEEAQALWMHLTEAHPEKVAFWVSLGQNLRAAGRTQEAAEAYRRAIAVEPDYGDAWWALASISKKGLGDADMEALQNGLKIAIDVANISPLHSALGRAWHMRGGYDKAFHHYSEANRLLAESINYDANELTAEVTEAMRVFDRNALSAMPPASRAAERPVFIVSLPRSGSTLLEQMLGSHAGVEPLGELPYIPSLLRGVLERVTQRGRATVPQAISSLSASQRQELGNEYLRRAALHRKTDAPCFIDKLPHNWNNVIFIRHILPNAKFIDIRRQPIDCCFANFSHSFTRAHGSSFALEHIGRAYVDYVRLMEHLDEATPGLVHHIRYEQLIEEPVRELRAALAFLDLPWDEACLRFHESGRAVRTPSAEQVRQPLNRQGVGAWKPYEQWLDELFQALRPVLDRPPAQSGIDA